MYRCLLEYFQQDVSGLCMANVALGQAQGFQGSHCKVVESSARHSVVVASCPVARGHVPVYTPVSHCYTKQSTPSLPHLDFTNISSPFQLTMTFHLTQVTSPSDGSEYMTQLSRLPARWVESMSLESDIRFGVWGLCGEGGASPGVAGAGAECCARLSASRMHLRCRENCEGMSGASPGSLPKRMHITAYASARATLPLPSRKGCTQLTCARRQNPPTTRVSTARFNQDPPPNHEPRGHERGWRRTWKST